MKYQYCKENFIILICSLFIFLCIAILIPPKVYELKHPFGDQFQILHKKDKFGLVHLHYILEIISMRLHMNDVLRPWLFICIPNDKCVVWQNISCNSTFIKLLSSSIRKFTFAAPKYTIEILLTKNKHPFCFPPSHTFLGFLLSRLYI